MPFKNGPTYDWEKDFTETVRRLFGDETLSFDEAVAAVRTADGCQLLDFDARARRWWLVDSRLAIRDRAGAMLKGAWRSPEYSDIQLFFESCSRNGYLREQATRALRGYPGRLSCAAALIRSEDWVDEVATAAQHLLEDLALSDAATHLFDLLDLVTALRLRQRFARRWQESIEPLLALPRWRAARRQALTRSDSSARLLAHELFARADPDHAADALRLAMNDPSPRLALFALAGMQSLPVETRRAMLREGMTHILGAVRSASLRRYREEGFDDLREVLVGALMDRNGAVRGAAAFALEREFAVAALPLWRAEFDACRNIEAMTAALAEVGDASDIGRLRSQLLNGRGRIRAAAFHGLFRIGVPDARALALQALRDPSSAVARTAARAYGRGTESLEESMLSEAFDAAGDARLRSRYVNLSALLPKWPRLNFLLALFRKMNSAEWPLVDRQLEDWLGKANRSYAQPGEDLRMSLAKAIEDVRVFHPASFWDKLRYNL